MKVLISAYACEPNRGSEPGVGWQWILELSKYHKVWVITRKNNRKKIEEFLEDNEFYKKRLEFIYIDLPKLLSFWKKQNKGIRLYYYMWQIAAFKAAKRYNKTVCFDLVHHITFVSYTQPSFMYKLNIPFVLGPVGGGENIPKIVNLKWDLKHKIFEVIRICSQYLPRIFPSLRHMLYYADIILTTTHETKEKIPHKFHYKTKVFPSIGESKILESKDNTNRNGKIKILMVGRFIPLKAIDIGIEAFKKLSKRYDNAELTILGKGKLKNDLIQLSGVHYNKSIFFVDEIEYKDILNFYSEHDIFINTSLRDSGCMVILEAMSAGLPIICIDTGGPRILTGNKNAFKIKPASYDKMIYDIENALYDLCNDYNLRIKMGQESIKKVKSEFLYSQKVIAMEKYYQEAIDHFKKKRNAKNE